MSEASVAHAGISRDLRDEVVAFLYREARFLDHADYDSWLALLAEDIRYVIQASPALYRRDGGARENDIAHMDDGLADLRRRIKRFQDAAAWAEDPPTRHCHIITNIEVEATDNKDEFQVYSAFVNARGRFELEDVIMAGRREDIVRNGEDGLRLVSRRVFLTQNVLLSRNINTFL
ncbi:MAG: 3-phenylpropionate/cinnamic acid dioxygenase subunit beta [Hyphomonadaceae bacterium]|nr:3-phenylpropionate/cinnamic acid dioxygenase subunit beta [Hyphomonadaceae bacterium]